MTTTIPDSDRRTALANRAQGGANWFYWIAGLSLLNSVVSLFAGEWNFIFGLGITQVLDALAQGLADGADGALAIRAGGLLFSIGALSLYVLFGWLANRGKTAGFVTGMTFYGLDGLIFVMAGDLLGAGFHGVALILMGRGFHAHLQLRKLPEPAPDSQTAQEQEIDVAMASLTEDADEYETVP